MNDRFELVNEVLEGALDLPSSEREAFVAARCGSNEDLLADVQRLLTITHSTVGFLDSPPPFLSEIRPGDVLGGRFHIIEELGAGGMGSIFLAEDRHLGEVALKTLRPEIRDDPRAIERFRAEVRTARTIRHPNVCPVFDLFTLYHGRGGPLVAFTMQYLRGETLAGRLSRGAIPAGEALQIASGIGAGLDALHAEGIIHRDLKPGNIMLTPGHDGSITPIIMDFGLASRSEAGRADLGSDLAFTSISGSPAYMAPEQFRTAFVTRSVDIYAFGLILFEMITGSRPFPREELLPAAIRRTTEDAPRVCAIAPWAPRAWDCAIARALSREASQRPCSAREVLDAVEGESAGREASPIRVAARCSHQPPRVSIHRARSFYPPIRWRDCAGGLRGRCRLRACPTYLKNEYPK
jgi:serine/threonine protein kinase